MIQSSLAVGERLAWIRMQAEAYGLTGPHVLAELAHRVALFESVERFYRPQPQG